MTSGALSLLTALFHSDHSFRAQRWLQNLEMTLETCFNSSGEMELNDSSLNATHKTDTLWDSKIVRYMAIKSVIILTCLCGMVGNGIVIWLLSFCTKRNHFSVYILNLAVADFTYLLADIFEIITMFIKYIPYLILFANMLAISSYSVGLNLLMAISIERCVSVLRPIWYKCHRPTHLSCIVCAIIWVLCFSYCSVNIVCIYFEVKDLYIMWEGFNILSLLTFPVLIVSSMILLLQSRSFSRQRQPSKLYITILLNVLAFLLLNVPRGIYIVCKGPKLYYDGIWSILLLLSAMNNTVNPIIYFFVGRHGQQRNRKPLREVLQSALMDEDKEAEQRSGSTINRQSMTSSEYQEGTVCSLPLSDPTEWAALLDGSSEFSP